MDCVCSEIRQAAGKIRFDETPQAEPPRHEELSLSSFRIGKILAKGCSAVVFAAKRILGKEEDDGLCEKVNSDEEIARVDSSETQDLAIKMMFNYDAESNSLAILRAMHR